MAFFKVHNVAVSAIVSCVPIKKVDNLNDPNIDEAQGKKIVDTTGIRYRRITEQSTTADLCYEAAKNILDNLKVDTDDIDYLFFVTQTPDFKLPATSMMLQERLGLSQSTMALDISLGCSGYVYGMSVISSMLEKAENKNSKALLLVGDTSSTLCNPKDLSTYPLFGDAGTATLLHKQPGSMMKFDLHSDGKGWESIVVKDGGAKNPYSEKSEIEASVDGKSFLRPRDLYLNGMDVFSFGISKVPKAIKAFYETADIDPEGIDYFLFHQANMFMNEKIRKKLKIEEEKVPYSLYEFGNVSSATIPITIATQLSEKITGEKNILACGFGVGLSWGVGTFTITANTFLNHIEL